LSKLINKTFRVLSVITAVALLLAYLAVWISPVKIWILAFFGLAYPYILLVAVFLLFFWLLNRKTKEFVFMLVFIILGWGHLNRFFRVPVKPERQSKITTDSLRQIKVLSYNVRLFNLYEKKSDNMDNIIRFIHNEDADIICLQEIYTGSSRMTEKMLIQKIGLPYNRINYLISGNKPVYYGMAIFSRFPIIGSGTIKYPDTYNTTMFCDVLAGKDTLRIFNNHLQSTRLKKTNYFLFSGSNQSESLKEILDISERLKDAFIKRAGQAEILHKKITESPYRVIVCGDFNDTPVSYTYHKITTGLKDAFLYNGKWLGKTYAGLLPSFRIDYIIIDRTLQPLDFRRYRNRYSDHFPVSCRILISPAQKEGSPDQHFPPKE